MSEWYEVHDPTRFLIVVAVALAVGFGASWIVNNEVHSDDVCDFARENYEIANSDEYQARVFNAANDSTEWNYLKEVYGKDAASEIMDARYSGTSLPAAFMVGAVIDACGEAP